MMMDLTAWHIDGGFIGKSGGTNTPRTGVCVVRVCQDKGERRNKGAFCPKDDE